MRKFLCLLFTVLLLLSSCTEDSGITPIPPISKDPATSALSEEPVDEAAICAEARRLLTEDVLVAGIFAGQSLAPFALVGEGSTLSDYHALSEESPYTSFSQIEALIDGTYTASGGMREFFLGYPAVGTNAIRKSANGGVEINLAYKSAFAAKPDKAALTLLSHNQGTYEIQYSEGNTICTVTLVETPAGLRLDKSLLYIYEQQLMAAQPKRILKTQDTGSAKTLRGDCDIIHLFVDTPNYKWTDKAQTELNASLASAWSYISQQASAYGVEDIRINEKRVYISSDANISDGSYADAWLLNTLADAGYDSLRSIAEAAGVVSENFAVIIHINGEGRSFSMADDGGGRDEYCVVFHSTKGSYRSCVATYIHELFHVFGAVDLYDEVLSEQGALLALLYFPADIMRIVPENTYTASVGVLTARLIGWCDSVPPQITEFLNKR